MLDDIVAFLEKYDSSYPASIKGASEEAIQQITRFVGRPLPLLYEEFLRRMGSDLGSMQIPNVTMNVNDIIDFYKSEDWRPLPRYVLIALERVDPYFDYYLDLEWPMGSDFGVVRFESSGVDVFESQIEPMFHSFGDMLFSFGFFYKRLESLPCRVDLLTSPAKEKQTGDSREELLKSVESLALRMGFERLLYTSPSCLILEREDATIYGYLPPRGDFAGLAAAQDQRQLVKIHEILRDNTIIA